MENDQRDPGEKAHHLSRRRFLLCGAATGGALVAGEAFWRAPRNFEVCEVRLRMEKIPPGRELRVVHLSDLHIRRFDSYLERVADKVTELRPDVVLLTGDYVERDRNLGAMRPFLERIEIPGEIFAVQGNWEYWARVEGDNLRDHFSRWGATVLINERADLNVRDVPLSILGLDYPSPSDGLLRLQGDADPARVNLLLSHVPAFSHDQLDGRIDLILSGHTHGGQVRIPFIPPLYLPRFSARYVSGLYRVGPDTPLYVNRGIGNSVFPVRFFCSPEITLLRLTAA